MTKRKSGILLHITSLPSKYGIGDLGEKAYEFVDFLKKSNQKIWQILPLGHTSFGDSPYQSFSTFANNPLLISIDCLIKDNLITEKEVGEIPNFDETKVDYGKVIDFKYSVYRKAYEKFKKEKNKKIISDYDNFCKSNEFWLDDYCLFVSLKNHFIKERKNTWETSEYKAYKKANEKIMNENTINDCFYGASWNSWPEDIATRKKVAIDKWSRKLKNEINFYKFLQYKFYEQWKKLKNYVTANDIEIIGDIPIFVAVDSADTWANPELFRLDSKGYPVEVAGVPPDYFSETGQLWGNPLYDWEYHKNTNYNWWAKRIKNMLNLVDVVRIDHFRAFDSYWSIPYGEKTAIKGEWKKGPGVKFFRSIEETLLKELSSKTTNKDYIKGLPIIAEDLGDLNPEVLELRDELGFVGMKILQFGFSGPDNDYLPYNYTTTNCIVYTGTHDNDTTIGWYEKESEETKDFVRRLLNVSGEDIAWDLIRYAFSTVSDIAIIPMQDVLCLGSDARMNTPGIAGGNWQFRFKDGSLSDEKADGLAYLTKLYNR